MVKEMRTLGESKLLFFVSGINQGKVEGGKSPRFSYVTSEVGTRWGQGCRSSVSVLVQSSVYGVFVDN